MTGAPPARIEPQFFVVEHYCSNQFATQTPNDRRRLESKGRDLGRERETERNGKREIARD